MHRTDPVPFIRPPPPGLAKGEGEELPQRQFGSARPGSDHSYFHIIILLAFRPGVLIVKV